jgi:uncharacterized protein YjiS (DUF1127 family)
MSVNPSTVARPAVTPGPGPVSRLLRSYCEGVAGYFVRRAAIARLRELDDRELRDIGLLRSQIEAAVCGLGHDGPTSRQTRHRRNR